jgi:purine-nucleoside phosphorylase
VSIKVRIEESAAALRKALGTLHVPETVIVLGSGFKGVADQLENVRSVELSSIRHFAVPAVAGHGSNLLIGDLSGERVCVLTGRVHLYEGHDADDVAHPIRVLAHLGAKSVLLTNASGSLSKSVKPGSLVLVNDQINLTGRTCLTGAADIGPQFPSMAGAFDEEWSRRIASLDRKIKRGIYVGVLGPAYETPAEARMLARLGAHVVGMSTVLEVIAARQLGLRVACLSFVTNMSGGIGETLTHDEVLNMARKHGPWLSQVVTKAVGVNRPDSKPQTSRKKKS